MEAPRFRNNLQVTLQMVVVWTGIIKWDPFWGGIKLDANIWRF